MVSIVHNLRRLWMFLASRRLAVTLLIVLLLTLLFATFFPQMPAEPGSQEMWLEAVNLRYGPATGLLKTLGMFNVYRSAWFLVLLTALLLNTLLCTVQRLPRLWRSFTESPVIQRPEAFYQGFAHRAEWVLDSQDQGLTAARDVLLRHRFQPHIERDEKAGCASLYAEQGRWSQASTLVSHFAAVLLIVAVICRPALGWQESNLTLLPGEVYHVGHGIDFEVRAGQPVTEPQPRVPLAVLTGTSVTTETVRINHPLIYRSVALHLQGYGPAAQIIAPEGTFCVAFSGSQAQQVTLPEAGLTLRVAHQPEDRALFVEALAAGDTLLGSGSVLHGQEIEIEGVPISFHLTKTTVWQVSRDPTLGIAVTSAVLLLIASVISLWVPHRRIWLRVDGEGRAQMVGAGDWAGEFDTIATEIARASCPQESTDG